LASVRGVPDARIADSARDHIYGVIRAAGGRITAPTRAVVGILLDSDRHLTADDLIAEVDRRRPGIAPSTIYRILQRLDELDVIEHVHPGTGPTFYHLRELRHAHLICDDCGTIVDIPDRVFAGLSGTVQSTYGFTIEPHHAALLGRCARCAP
jgi:Fur family ferric uptake transcriptional regulator